MTCLHFSDTGGKGWARVRDIVPCPRGRGDPPWRGWGFLDDGHAVAGDRCKTGMWRPARRQPADAPSQSQLHSGASGAVSDAANTSLNGFGVVPKGLASRDQDEQITSGQSASADGSKSSTPPLGHRCPAARVRSTWGEIRHGHYRHRKLHGVGRA
jgi:hypothetical protein